MSNKGIGVTLLALLVLVIFAVNKTYENHQLSNLPLVLEVDEADIHIVDLEPTSLASKISLPPDNFKRSAQRYMPQSFITSLQDQLNPWLASKNKIVTKRAIVFAKRVNREGGREEQATGTESSFVPANNAEEQEYSFGQYSRRRL